MLTDDSWKLLFKIMYLTGRIYNKPVHRKMIICHHFCHHYFTVNLLPIYSTLLTI